MQDKTVPEHPVLLITTIAGAENLGATLSKSAEVELEVVRSRRAALASLRRRQFAAIIVDAALPDTESTDTDALWRNCNGAAPLGIDVAALGAMGLARLLCNVLQGREQMKAQIREKVMQAMSQDLRSTVTGLLLQSDLALKEKALTPAVEYRVRELRALADGLRLRYRPVL